MKLYLQFALRYFNSKKEKNFSTYASILAILGLSIGLFSLILTISIIDGFENILERKLSNIDGLVRISNIFDEPINNLSKNDSLLKKHNDLFKINKFIRTAGVIRSGNSYDGVIIEGVDQLPKGLFFNQEYKYINNGKIVISKFLSEYLDAKIGDKIIISLLNDVSYPIVDQKFHSIEIGGIYKSGIPEYDKNLVFISLLKAREISGMKTGISGYIINSDQPIKKVLKKLDNIFSYPNYIESWKDRHQIIFEWINTQRLPIIIVFSLIALVGIANIMATISMIVNTKKHEIAILVSQGMKLSKIRLIFMNYSVLLGIAGYLVGSIFSILFIYIQNNFKIISLPNEIYFMDYLPMMFNYKIFISTFFITILTSSVSSLYPTMRILKLKPSEILI